MAAAVALGVALVSAGPPPFDGTGIPVASWVGPIETCRMSQTPETAPAYVSIENQMPEDLFDAMREFIRLHPQWDQYRLMQAALAGFLFQHGCHERSVARHYLDGLFQRPASQALRP